MFWQFCRYQTDNYSDIRKCLCCNSILSVILTFQEENHPSDQWRNEKRTKFSFDFSQFKTYFRSENGNLLNKGSSYRHILTKQNKTNTNIGKYFTFSLTTNATSSTACVTVELTSMLGYPTHVSHQPSSCGFPWRVSVVGKTSFYSCVRQIRPTMSSEHTRVFSPPRFPPTAGSRRKNTRNSVNAGYASTLRHAQLTMW